MEERSFVTQSFGVDGTVATKMRKRRPRDKKGDLTYKPFKFGGGRARSPHTSIVSLWHTAFFHSPKFVPGGHGESPVFNVK